MIYEDYQGFKYRVCFVTEQREKNLLVGPFEDVEEAMKYTCAKIGDWNLRPVFISAEQ